MESLETLILYAKNNYDTQKEKKENIMLLQCYVNSNKINKMKIHFLNYKDEDVNSSLCKKEPLLLLNGNYSAWKYLWESFLFK